MPELCRCNFIIACRFGIFSNGRLNWIVRITIAFASFVTQLVQLLRFIFGFDAPTAGNQRSQSEQQAWAMISTVSEGVRRRFPDKVLAPLLDSGWHERRYWEADRLQEFLNRFDLDFPPSAIKLLTEFGGLSIGFRGRTVNFGEFEERLYDSHTILNTLVGTSLFPVGVTNLFEDDGLGVLIDADGQIYVDGATGYNPPRDFRVDLISDSIDSFLSRLFCGERTPERQSWYYSESDLS